jgi:hypothetical protein
MPESATHAAAAAVVVLVVLVACRQGEPLPQSRLPAVSTGALADACAGDSLRPAAAAPAQGLWLYERPSTTERVAAMIGPPRADDRALVLTRPVESVEVSATGDTIRHRLPAATVSLELLPPLGPDTFGGRALGDSAASAHPAATYAVSPRVRLAAYEPCATSVRGSRIRYLRRDADGRIVTDVMLRRASEQ